MNKIWKIVKNALLFLNNSRVKLNGQLWISEYTRGPIEFHYDTLYFFPLGEPLKNFTRTNNKHSFDKAFEDKTKIYQRYSKTERFWSFPRHENFPYQNFVFCVTARRDITDAAPTLPHQNSCYINHFDEDIH